MRLSKIFSVMVSIMLAFLVACGGGGSSSSPAASSTPDPVELSGQFVDSAVAGLVYVTSSGLTGTTDAAGTFIYKAGDTVKFYLGDILLGEATGAAFITPVALVPGAKSEADTTVLNIARLLQTLDSDSDPSNGINISATVFMAAKTKSIDFTLSTVDFEAAASTLLGEIFTIVGSASPALVSGIDAALHLEGSLLCGRAGHYTGSFTGTSSGSWSFDVWSDGGITGNGTSVEGAFTIYGSVDSSGAAAVGSTNTGATFSGTVGVDGSVSGTWEDTTVIVAQGGTFSGSRTSSPSTPCIASGTPTESSSPGTGTGGTPSVSYGSLSMSNQPGFGTLFTPIKSTGVEAAGIGIIEAYDYDLTALTHDADTHYLLVRYDAGTKAPISIKMFGVTLSLELRAYSLDCSVSDCSAVSIDTVAHTVTFNSASISVDTSESSNSADAPVILVGTLSYTPSSTPSSGGTTVDTSAYAATYSGTLDGTIPGTWTFTVDSSGHLNGSAMPDAGGTNAFTATVDASGTFSGSGSDSGSTYSVYGSIASNGSVTGVLFFLTDAAVYGGGAISGNCPLC